MAVRPWENRFLDINTRDGVMVCENGAVEGKNGIRSQLRSSSKKSVPSNIHSNLISQKTGPSLSDSCDSSPSNSKPGLGSRSHSNPKERMTQVNKQAKKRLSLPNNGEFVLYLSIFFSCTLEVKFPKKYFVKYTP